MKPYFALALVLSTLSLASPARAKNILSGEYNPACIQAELRSVINSERTSLEVNEWKTIFANGVGTAGNLIRFVPRALGATMDFPEVYPDISIIGMNILKRGEPVYAECSMTEDVLFYKISQCSYYSGAQGSQLGPYQVKYIFNGNVPKSWEISKSNLERCTASTK